MQSRIKDTSMELLIVFGMGGLIGTLIAWTSNAYVSGFSFLQNSAKAIHFSRFRWREVNLSSPV